MLGLETICFHIIHISLFVNSVSVILHFMQEKPRNHLDMRHRLDSKGQREGKVIDYR